MKYHDDGEKELGPTVATMALGAPSSMHIRMKERYFRGYKTGNVSGVHFDPDVEILPGSAHENKRRELAASTMSAEEKNQEMQGLVSSKKPIHGDILRMAFNHGDIIIMHGAEVQKYFEVKWPLLYNP